MKKLTKYITFICVICMLCIPVHAKTLTVKLPKKTVKQTMNVGKKLSLKVKYKGRIVTKKVKFSSSKKSVATVSKKGVITAKKVGKAIITLKYKVKKKTYVSRITLKVVKAKKTSKTSAASNTTQKKNTSSGTAASAGNGSNGSSTDNPETSPQSDLPCTDEFGYVYNEKVTVNGITFYYGLFNNNYSLDFYSKQEFDRDKFSIKIGNGNVQLLGVEDPEYEFLGKKNIQMYREHYVYPNAKNPVAFVITENPEYRKKLFPGWKYYSIYLTFVQLNKEVPIEVYYDGNLVYKKNVAGKTVEDIWVKNLKYFKEKIGSFVPSENANTFADEILELCGYIYKTFTYEELDCKSGAFAIYWYAAERGYKGRYYFFEAPGVYGYGPNSDTLIPGHTGCELYIDGQWDGGHQANGHH